MYDIFFSMLWKQRRYLITFWILEIIFYILGIFFVSSNDFIFSVIADFTFVTVFFDEYENFKERLQCYWLAVGLLIAPLAIFPMMGVFIVPKLLSTTLVGVLLLHIKRLIFKLYK